MVVFKIVINWCGFKNDAKEAASWGKRENKQGLLWKGMRKLTWRNLKGELGRVLLKLIYEDTIN